MTKGGGVSPATPGSPSAKRVRVYILHGQSNMQGIGNVSLLPSGNPLKKLLPKGFIYNRFSHAAKGWEHYSAGVNTQCNLTSNNPITDWYGPEGSFLHHMSEAFNEDIYVIKLGFGGTVLSPTGGGYSWTKGAADLFDIYINGYVKSALQALREKGLQPVIMGSFRYQGESDTYYDYNNFGTLRAQFSTDLKAALGLTTLREIETRLHVNLHSDYNPTAAAIIRTAQENFVAADPVNRKLLTVDECTMNADSVHIDGSLTGQWLVGKKAAQLMAAWESVTIS
jgi:hypothetical protein